jgi:hypothetical protein
MVDELEKMGVYEEGKVEKYHLVSQSLSYLGPRVHYNLRLYGRRFE